MTVGIIRSVTLLFLSPSCLCFHCFLRSLRLKDLLSIHFSIPQKITVSQTQFQGLLQGLLQVLWVTCMDYTILTSTSTGMSLRPMLMFLFKSWSNLSQPVSVPPFNSLSVLARTKLLIMEFVMLSLHPWSPICNQLMTLTLSTSERSSPTPLYLVCCLLPDTSRSGTGWTCKVIVQSGLAFCCHQ